jgi:hypothetical protein
MKPLPPLPPWRPCLPRPLREPLPVNARARTDVVAEHGGVDETEGKAAETPGPVGLTVTAGETGFTGPLDGALPGVVPP